MTTFFSLTLSRFVPEVSKTDSSTLFGVTQTCSGITVPSQSVANPCLAGSQISIVAVSQRALNLRSIICVWLMLSWAHPAECFTLLSLMAIKPFFLVMNCVPGCQLETSLFQTNYLYIRVKILIYPSLQCHYWKKNIFSDSLLMTEMERSEHNRSLK